MNKILKITIILVLLNLGGLSINAGETISLINSGESLQGVDGDISLWSTNDSTKNLWRSNWDLLGGKATVTGYVGPVPWFLSHRGTRGLGVWNFFGRENDEIDSKWDCFFPERIEITFNNKPYWLNNLEIRSLFYEPNLWRHGSGVEEGHLDFFLKGNKVGEQHFVGWEDIRTLGTKGINYFTYDRPPVVDKLVFYVPTGESYTVGSEFALAKLGVTATPEPVSTILFLTGGAILVARRFRKKSDYSPKRYSACSEGKV